MKHSWKLPFFVWLIPALFRPEVGLPECGIDPWPPCIWEDLTVCGADELAVVAENQCINNPAVEYAELFDYDNDGVFMGVVPEMSGHTLELPPGISVIEVFLEGNRLYGCQTATRTDMGLRFQAAYGASEGPFTVPFFMQVREHWTDRSPEYKTFKFVFKGWIALERAKLVVKATSLTASNPDHGKELWFVDPDSEIENLPAPRYLNADFLDLLMFTSETSAAYKLEVYRESRQPVTLGDLRVVRYGGIFDEAYCLSLTDDGPCKQSLGVNASLPQYPDVSAKDGEDESDPHPGFTFFLKLGTNPNYPYESGDYGSTLELLSNDACEMKIDYLGIDGRIMENADLGFLKLGGLSEEPISDGGTVKLPDVYPLASQTIGFRVTNEGDESFSGILTLNDTSSTPGYGFSLAGGDELTVNLGPGRSKDFDIVFRTDREIGKKYEAKVVARHDTGRDANYFKLEATVKDPLKVEIKGSQGGWKTLAPNARYDAPHLGLPPEERVDKVRVTNPSEVGIYVSLPNLRHEEGAGYPYIENITGMNRTLFKGESATFDIVNAPPGCGLHSTDTVTFEYGVEGAPGQPPGDHAFAFTYATEACVPRAVEFDWNGLPVSPPFTLRFKLRSAPDGTASVRGTLTLRLTLPASRDERALTISTSGSSFSHTFAESHDPDESITLEETKAQEVKVRFRPTDFGVFSGTLKIKDSVTSYTWSFDLYGETCGLDGKESCHGVCSDDLQLCSGDICRYCCGNESNGLCGIQSGGAGCSGEPGANGYDFDCCQGTNYRWQSDFAGQTPYRSPDQPSSPVCLADNRCLSPDGSAVPLGRVESPQWACGTELVNGRLQGVWYQCEESRAAAETVIAGLECVASGTTYKWALPVRRASRRVAAFLAKIGGQNVEGLRIQDTSPAIDFTWAPPEDPPSPFVRYQIVVQPTDGSGWLYSPRLPYSATAYTLQTANLVPDRSYSTHIRAKFEDGEWGEFVRGGTFTVEPDTTEPSAPGPTTSLDCLYKSGGTCFVENKDFVIRVDPATDSGSGVNPKGYRICRSHDATGWAGCNVTMTWNGVVAFTVTGTDRPAPGQRRAYYFRAQDMAGNLGPWNQPLYVQTLEEAADTTPPSAPGPTTSLDCLYTSNGTCFVADGDFVIRVSPATDSGSGVNPKGYRICRSHDATGWAGCNVMMTWNGGVTFTVTGGDRPAPGQRRAYYFRAQDMEENWGPWNQPLYVQTLDPAVP